MEEANHVSAHFHTRAVIRTEECARKFFELLRRQDEVLVPEEFDGGALTGHRWVAFDPASPDLAVRAWMETGFAVMRRSKPMESAVDATMHFGATGGFDVVSVSVEERYFALRNHIDSFLALGVALYRLVHPAYGGIHDVADKIETRTVMDPRYGRTIMPTNLKKGLPGVYWANFLGPEYLEMIGRERLLSAPCYRRQELPDGGMLLLTSESPLEPAAAENRQAQLELRQYLGEDLFYPSQAAATRLPEFRGPPPPSSHDASPRVTFESATPRQRAKAQNLIDSAEDLAFLLIEEWAERGIALDRSLSSLRVLDDALRQKSEAGEMLDDFSARMFAAYAGEVARQALHGQWVVDKVTGQAAVQVKGAKIFPMARLLKFFESDETDAFASVFAILGVVTGLGPVDDPNEVRDEEAIPWRNAASQEGAVSRGGSAGACCSVGRVQSRPASGPHRSEHSDR